MEKENKIQYLSVRVNGKQVEFLKNEAEKHGFSGISEYVRFELFFSVPISEKINKMFAKICETNE